jgi:hypothetical protein
VTLGVLESLTAAAASDFDRSSTHESAEEHGSLRCVAGVDGVDEPHEQLMAMATQSTANLPLGDRRSMTRTLARSRTVGVEAGSAEVEVVAPSRIRRAGERQVVAIAIGDICAHAGRVLPSAAAIAVFDRARERCLGEALRRERAAAHIRRGVLRLEEPTVLTAEGGARRAVTNTGRIEQGGRVVTDPFGAVLQPPVTVVGVAVPLQLHVVLRAICHAVVVKATAQGDRVVGLYERRTVEVVAARVIAVGRVEDKQVSAPVSILVLVLLPTSLDRLKIATRAAANTTASRQVVG